jgi:DMSO/TMAO reductase YedYZ molybdopterin-dependent catalytic subunit
VSGPDPADEREEQGPMAALFPDQPPPGPFRRSFWRSPLRGPWLTSVLGSLLLPLVVICAVTGFLSHLAYSPDIAVNPPSSTRSGGFDIYFFDWPTRPTWLYALTQGLHVIAGLMAVPILLAKLWSVMPKLFEWPPVRSPAHQLERLSLALLVGSTVLLLITGIFNIQLYYPWEFSFLVVHYYTSFVFVGALALHLGLKLPIVWRQLREHGLRPLHTRLADTKPEAAAASITVATEPAAPTISRRGLFGMVGAATALLGVMGTAQSIGGPFRRLGVLAPHGQEVTGQPNAANDFQVNKTAASVGITPAQTDPPAYRFTLAGPRREVLTRADLLAMEQHTADLTIACVEGWSTTQQWTGVRLRDLRDRVGAAPDQIVLVESLQGGGSFAKARLTAAQIDDELSLLALKVNGEDLSLDHGFPARVIVPAMPGVHCTKWVRAMTFQAAPS